MYLKTCLLLVLFFCSYFPWTAFADRSMYSYKCVGKEHVASYRRLISSPFSLDESFTLHEDRVHIIFEAIHRYLRKDESREAKEVKKHFPHHYGYQLLGFKSRGAKMVLINAFLKDEGMSISDEAVLVRDGGCGYARFIYTIEKDSLVFLQCNGEA